MGCKQFRMLKYCLIHSIHTLAPYKNELLTTLVVAFNDDETGNKGKERCRDKTSMVIVQNNSTEKISGLRYHPRRV